CRNCCGIQLCDPRWMSTPRHSRQPNMQLRQRSSRWCFRVKRMKCHSRRDQMTLQGEGKSTETKRDTNKGTKTCPFGSSIVSGEFVQLFWKEMAGTTRLELATSAVTVGGHLLIPQGTVCHFLSSPYCTQIVFAPLLSTFSTFLAFGILL